GDVKEVDLKDIHKHVRNLIDLAEALNFNLYQTSNAMSLFWYVLPHYKVEELDYIMVVCIFMTIRRSTHVKVNGSDKFYLDNFIKYGFDIPTLREKYTNVYQYMNGITHVESVGDYSNDGATLAHSFGYYSNPVGSMQDHVLRIQSSREPFMLTKMVGDKKVNKETVV